MSLSPEQLKAISLLAEGIPAPKVATKIGVAYRTLQRWHKKPEFKKALEELRLKTQAKVFEKSSEGNSEKIAIDVRKLQREHLNCYGSLRRIAEVALRHYEKILIEQGQSPDEISIRSLHLWAQILDRAVRGEADSAFFKYLDLNAAIDAVHQQGYIVSFPPMEEGENPIQLTSFLELN
jgi:transposase